MATIVGIALFYFIFFIFFIFFFLFIYFFLFQKTAHKPKSKTFSDVYSEPCQTSKMKRFAKIVNSFYSLTTSTKRSILVQTPLFWPKLNKQNIAYRK